MLKTLKSQLYHELIYAVNFNLKHQQTIGDLLNKLDPSKRNAIKEKAKNKLGPRTIDFFCGAGGLSLGFSQEGFNIDLANDYEDVCIETVESGKMTKDLALLVGKNQEFLTTAAFMDKVDDNFKQKVS